MCLQVWSLSPDRKTDPETLLLAKKGVCISKPASHFSLTWHSVSSWESCSYMPETYQKGGRKILKPCQILRIVAHRGSPCTHLGWWVLVCKCSGSDHLVFACMGNINSVPLINSLRVLVYSHIEIVGLEKFLKEPETTEGCLQTPRREEVEKMTNASLKSEIKRTECHGTRSKVIGFG